MAAIRRLTVGNRPLTLGKKFLVALTSALTVATLALAAATSARAGNSGVLPDEGPFFSGPATAVSHTEDAPNAPAGTP